MELSHLTQHSYLPIDVTRGVLLGVPLSVQAATSTTLLNHMYDVLGGLLYVAQGQHQETHVGLTEEESAAAAADNDVTPIATVTTPEEVTVAAPPQSPVVVPAADEEKSSSCADSCASPTETPKMVSSTPTTVFSHLSSFAQASSLFRSEADIHYLTNTIGVIFAFPLTEDNFGLVNRALDLYGLFLHADFAREVMGPFLGGGKGQQKPSSSSVRAHQEAIFLALIEHLTLLFAERPKGATPPTTTKMQQRHADAVCRGIDILSKSVRLQAHTLSPATFRHILRVVSGASNFVLCSKESPFQVDMSSALAVRYALSSLLFELLVRSNVRHAPSFQLIVNSSSLNLEIATQWSQAVVGLTRAMTAILSRPTNTATNVPIPSTPVVIDWCSVQGHVRDKSTFTGLSSESVVFMWKRLLEVVFECRTPQTTEGGDVEDVIGPDVQEVIASTLRDVSTLLSTASLWHIHTTTTVDTSSSPSSIGAMLPIMNPKCSAPQCPKAVALGPSTNAVMKVVGSRLFALLCGNDNVRNACLQGLSIALLRRESAMSIRQGDAAVNHWVSKLFDRISAMREDASARVMVEIVLHISPVFHVDIPVPLLALETVGFAACAFVFGLLDEAIKESNPSSPTTASILQPLDRTPQLLTPFEIQSKTTAAASLVSCLSHINVLGMPTTLTTSILASLTHAIETHSHNKHPDTLLTQCLINAGILALYVDNGTAVDEAADLLQRLVDICKAPYGSYDHAVLLSAITALGSVPLSALNRQIAVGQHVLDTLCSVCVQARTVMEQGDLGIEDTSSVYCCATRAMSTLINQRPDFGKLLCRDVGTSRMILRAAAVGLREVLLPQGNMREAALRLIAVHQACIMGPMVRGSCDASSQESEGSYLKNTSHMSVISIGAYRLVTVIQLKDSQDVVLIQRDPTGRRVFEVSLKNPTPTALHGTNTNTITMSDLVLKKQDGGGEDEGTTATTGFLSSKDVLEFIQADPYSKWVEEQLHSDPLVIKAISEEKSRREVLAANTISSSSSQSTATTFPPACNDPLPDPTSDASLTARAVLNMLLLTSDATVRHIPLSRASVGVLKGIDLLSPRDRFDVPVICATDNGSSLSSSSTWGSSPVPEGFRSFCEALGWKVPSAPNTTFPIFTHQDCATDLYFVPSVMSISDLANIQEAAVRSVGGGASTSAVKRSGASSGSTSPRQVDVAECAKVRIVWDFTSAGYDWSTNQHSHHDAVKRLSPQFTPSQTSFIDIVVRPLPSVGLFNVRVDVPSNLGSWGMPAATTWAAPLLHGVALPGTVLAPLIRSAVTNAFLMRAEGTRRGQNPIATRQAALSTLISQYPVMLPHQANAIFD